MNRKIILYILGVLLIIEGLSIWSAALVALIYHEPDFGGILLSGGLCVMVGGLFWLFTRQTAKTMGKREGFFIVTLAWILFSAFGALPFVITGGIPRYTDALFETVSGFTTTGASILDNVESLSHGLLFWRSMTHWLGGMGIIVLSLAILPLLGIGGMQLFVAEVPGPVKDKLHPRIKETAKRLWAIYIIYTALETILLSLGDMDVFDAICHSFATMATGGYSTKQASIAYYDSPYIHYVITLFMFLAGMNFTLSYFIMHLKFRKVIENDEFRFYAGIAVVFTLIFTARLFLDGNQSAEESFRESAFQVVSIMTTTGFVTVDYLLWSPLLVMLILVLMFIGGSAGSTAGSIKVVRILLALKNSFLEIKRMLHPNAIVPVRYNKHVVPTEIIINIMSFIMIYFIVFFIGTAMMAAMGYSVDSSVGSVASCLGNVGPALGALGPAETYSAVPDLGKWLLSFLMLVGRLELFTVFMIFVPGLYRK